MTSLFSCNRFLLILSSLLFFPAFGLCQSTVSVDFENQSSSTVHLYLTSSSGAQELYGSIPPNKTFRQQSHPQNTWQLKVGTRLLGQYVATSLATQKVTIDRSGRIGGTATTPVQPLPGGFSTFGPVNVQTLSIFKQAVKNHIGSEQYTPLEVSTQVVAGMNYRFRCLATRMVPGGSNNGTKRMVIVQIYDGINSAPKVTGITADPNSTVPSTTPTTNITPSFNVNFRSNPTLNTAINWDAPNYPQIQMAIAMVTNETRVKNGKTPLVISAHLANAAQMHADDMVAGKFFSHTNSLDRAKSTPNSRAGMNGIANPVIAENINQGFGIKYKAGTSVRPLGGGNFATPEGKQIVVHTPLSLADSLFEVWLKSPPHKKNILDDEALAVGCGAKMFRDSTFHQMPTVYAVQMFQRQQAIQVSPGY